MHGEKVGFESLQGLVDYLLIIVPDRYLDDRTKGKDLRMPGNHLGLRAACNQPPEWQQEKNTWLE